MMRYFENPNDLNKVYGFDSQDHAQADLLQSAIDGKWKEVTGNWPPTETLENARMAQVRKINEACNAALQAIVLPYPPLEVATWPNQLAEASAYQTNANALTPTLSAIVVESGQTVATLAASVLNKAAAYSAASGAAIGKRQALTAQIMAVQAASNSQADVDAAKAAVKSIVW